MDLCSRGDILSQAMKHFNGWETERNFKTSLEFLDQQIIEEDMKKEKKTEIDLEYLSICIDLKGIILYYGSTEVEKNTQKSFECFEKASEMNNSDAIYNLACIYNSGEENIVGIDLIKSVELYKRAIDLKHSFSMYNLAFIYEYGYDYIEKDIKTSIDLYQKAIAFNHVDALNNFARMYQTGVEGILEKNVLKTIELYERAVELEDFNCTFNLAILYQKGEENKNVKIEIDLDKSAHYYFKSDQLGDENGKEQLIWIIQNNKINWKEEYHVFWKGESDLNRQILMILFVCKFRKNSNDKLISSILVKGISVKIIKFLCHLKQI